MRIHMQDALASLLELDKGHLATAANAATRPSPSLPDSWSPPPEPPQAPEHESVTWLRAATQGDMAKAKAVLQPEDQWYSPNDLYREAACVDWDEAEVLALYSPGAVIARCEAELTLLDLHGPNRYGYCLTCDPDSCGCVGSGDYPCATVCTILAGYRHREGFNPEWVSA